MNLKWGKPLVIVEGNIGSGKSTTSKEIASRLKLRLLEEPVDHELLDLFYKDKNRWSFPFQIEMLHSRWALQMSAAAETNVSCGYSGAILDRSLWGDLVFANALTEAGIMHSKEWDIYLRAVRNMAMVLFPPTLLLYLAARPETCLERIRERNRPQEAGMTLEYLQLIHNGYQHLVHEAKTGFFPWSHAVNVITMPADPKVLTPGEWDRIAATVKESFRAS